jgi:hypothetical protein
MIYWPNWVLFGSEMCFDSGPVVMISWCRSEYCGSAA